MTTHDPPPLRIAVVCTANRFRSPVTEAVIERLAPQSAAYVASAAARGASGQPAVESVVRRMAAHGFDLAQHRSRRLGAGQLADFDLVVVFEAHHAAAVIADGGAPRERTFLLRELLQLLPEEHAGTPRGPGEVRALLADVARYRFEDFFAPHHQYADPMLGPARAHAAAVDDLVDLSSSCATRLFGLRGGPLAPVPAPASRGRWFRR